MRIGQQTIGRGAPYIIAEIGVNHDGSRARMLELIDAAADTQADAVKFQYFEARRLLSRSARLADYQERSGASDPFQMLRDLELSLHDLSDGIDRAHQTDLHAIVTVFSIEHVPAAAKLGWDAFKTASPDLTNRPLIDAIRMCGRPMIVSTGAATLDEVRRAHGWIEDTPHALLQCVSAYPTPLKHASLRGIAAIRELGIENVGYSDHTESTQTGADAVRHGAVILEKHLTYDRCAAGPDHAASLDPLMFAEYVQRASEARFDPGAVAQGRPEKRVLDIERDVRCVSRQSITAARHLTRGRAITRVDLTVKRPGTGIEPWRMDSIIGRVLTHDVAADTPLCDEDLAAVGAAALCS